jgi:hypothetical protein
VCHYDSYYTDNYYQTSTYAGNTVLSLVLNPADLAEIQSTGRLGFTASGSNEPDLIANSLSVNFAPVPLPPTAWLMLSGLGFLFALHRRKLVRA